MKIITINPRRNLGLDRENDRNVLSDIPNNEFVYSYTDFLKLTKKNKFTYDAIITSFSANTNLKDLDGGVEPYDISSKGITKSEAYRNLYSISYQFFSKILDNTFAKLIVYSGADSFVQREATRYFKDRFKWIKKTGSYENEKTAIELSIIESLVEYRIRLNEQDKFEIIQASSRMPIGFKIDNIKELLVKPHFTNSKIIYESQLREFEYLINKNTPSEKEIQQFLESHPQFLLGNKYKGSA